MSDTATFAARSPLAEALSSGEGHGAAGGNAGVTAVIRDGNGLATVMARSGASDALNQRIRERFGIDLPQGPHRSAATGVAFVGMGPGSWLALAERDGNDFAAKAHERAGWSGIGIGSERWLHDDPALGRACARRAGQIDSDRRGCGRHSRWATWPPRSAPISA